MISFELKNKKEGFAFEQALFEYNLQNPFYKQMMLCVLKAVSYRRGYNLRY